MSIIWMGGEDIDIWSGVATEIAHPEYYRSGFARTSIYYAAGGTAKTLIFSGTATGSMWFSLRAYVHAIPPTGSNIMFGLSKYSDDVGYAGLYFGMSADTSYQAALLKRSSSTNTRLVTESGTSLTSGSHHFSMHVQNYGASGTVTGYADGQQIFTYTGDITCSGVANFDTFRVFGYVGGLLNYSEVVIADEDTRNISVVTLYPTSDVTNEWTGSYSWVDEIVNNATTPGTEIITANSGSVSATFRVGMSDLPAGAATSSVKAVRLEATLMKSNAAGTVHMGMHTNGVTDTNYSITPNLSWGYWQRVMNLNPVTTASWTPAEVNDMDFVLKTGNNVCHISSSKLVAFAAITPGGRRRRPQVTVTL